MLKGFVFLQSLQLCISVAGGTKSTPPIFACSLKDAELSIAELTQDPHMQGKCRITMMAMDKV